MLQQWHMMEKGVKIMLEKFFGLKERETTIRTEILAGMTTFMTMAYILAVNPSILSQAGMNEASVFAATAISAAVATLIMGITANLPVALAPGMGLNAFFAFSVVLGMGYSWQFALTAVFLEGLIFIFLTITNLREAILRCIPEAMKKAISGGIGLFIAFIGLKSAGVVVNNEATLVGMGSLTSPGVLVAVFSIILTGILLCYKVRGALLIGIFAGTLLGIPLQVTNLAGFDSSLLFSVPSLEPTFLKFQWEQVLSLDMALVLFTFLFVDLFDTLGTLVGLATKANILDADGNIPRAKSALMADALGTTLGAMLGTSTVTSYVESASGVAEGGKTGLTAVTVAVFFLLSLFLAPIFLLIPAQATASALVLVGLFMLSPITGIDFNDYQKAIPAFLTFIMMPLTYSIATGIMWGVIAHVLIAIGTGKMKELNVLSYLLAIMFIAKFAMG